MPDRNQLQNIEDNTEIDIEKGLELAQAIVDGVNPNADQDRDELLFSSIDFDQDGEKVNEELPAPVARVVYHPEIEARVVENRIGHAGQNEEAEIEKDGFQPLLSMPGYADRGPHGTAIRDLGRSIFRQIPCFAEMAELCRPQGIDPLGQIHVVSGSVPDDRVPNDFLGSQTMRLRQRGLPLDSDAFEVFARMRGYRPRLRFAFTEEDSYLLVEERRALGCAQDTTYLYCWKGGKAFYEKNPEAALLLKRLGRELPPDNARLLIAGDVRAPRMAPNVMQLLPNVTTFALAPEAVAPRRRVAAEPVKLVKPLEKPLEKPADPKVAELIETIKQNAENKEKEQVAKTISVNAMQALRHAGFQGFGTPTGPALKLDRDDGYVVVVKPAEGKSLSMAKVFTSTVYQDIDAEPIASETFANVADLIEWSNITGVAPKP